MIFRAYAALNTTKHLFFHSAKLQGFILPRFPFLDVVGGALKRFREMVEWGFRFPESQFARKGHVILLIRPPDCDRG